MIENTFIIIPVYNEQKLIVTVISELLKLGYKNIIIVDDGSTDDLISKINTLPIHYTQHIINRGKGSALRTGMRIGKKLGAQCIVTMDGDGQHSAEDVAKLVNEIEMGNDVKIANQALKLILKKP